MKDVLPMIEKRLVAFNARPHWGKLFTMTPEHIASLYRKLPEFRELLRHYDSQGKFRNAYLNKYIFGEY